MPGSAVAVLERSARADVLSDELASVYCQFFERLQRSTVLQGEPATVELRERYDDRVWGYLVWLGEGQTPTDPFGARGRAARSAIDKTLRAYGQHLRRAGDLDELGVVEVLATLVEFHRRAGHGGNRLGPDHPYRAWTPSYERCREFPPDPERRDKRQRERTRRSAGLARARGELSRTEADALEVMLGLTDDRCSETWHSLATIGREAGGFDERTAGEWLARLGELGWVQRRHRFVQVEGRIEATSNMWRIDIPEHLRVELLAREEAKRRRTREENRAARPGRHTPSPRTANARPVLAPVGHDPVTAEEIGAEHDRDAARPRGADPGIMAQKAQIAEVRAQLRRGRSGSDPERGPP